MLPRLVWLVYYRGESRKREKSTHNAYETLGTGERRFCAPLRRVWVIVLRGGAGSVTTGRRVSYWELVHAIIETGE